MSDSVLVENSVEPRRTPARYSYYGEDPVSIPSEASALTSGIHPTAQLSRPPTDFVIPLHLRLGFSAFHDPSAEGVASLIVLRGQKIGQWVGISTKILGRLAENERRKVINDDEGGEVFVELGSWQAMRAGLDWLTLHHIVVIKEDVVYPTELLADRLSGHVQDAA